MRTRITAALVGCLLLSGCGNGSKSAAPTGPTNPTPPASSLSIVMSGGLSSLNGGLLEATILFDGQEVQGARTACLSPSTACVFLVLTPQTVIPVTAGQHTVSFQVTRQFAQGRASYTSVGQVVVSRGGPPVQSITLTERTANLGTNESITYQITIPG